MGRRAFLSAAAGVALAAPPRAGLDRFQLAATTDEIDDDLLTAIRFLKRFGLRHAELRKVRRRYNTEQPLGKIREARRLLDQHGPRTKWNGAAWARGSSTTYGQLRALLETAIAKPYRSRRTTKSTAVRCEPARRLCELWWK